MVFEQIHGLFLHLLPSLLQIFHPCRLKMKIGGEMVEGREEMVNMIIDHGLLILQYWLAFLAKPRRRGLSETEKHFCFIVNSLMYRS